MPLWVYMETWDGVKLVLYGGMRKFTSVELEYIYRSQEDRCKLSSSTRSIAIHGQFRDLVLSPPLPHTQSFPLALNHTHNAVP